ncbi:OmpA family protein [Candidatus Nitrospira salsa]
MPVNVKSTFFPCLIFCMILSGCQSMVTHEYSSESQSQHPSSSLFPTDSSMTLDTENNRTEALEEDPISPIGSTDTLSGLTPASYYHSPDPPNELPEYVPSLFFDYDSWTLTNKGKHILELTAMQLKENPESSLIIEGHCDDRGAEGYNLVLGDKRALMIKEYLVNLGIAENRLIPVSFGDTHPVCFEDHETCHALNRRGYLVLLTKPQ